MSAPSPTAPGPGPIGILLRLAALLAIIVAATWASHLLREALDLQITPETEPVIDGRAAREQYETEAQQKLPR